MPQLIPALLRDLPRDAHLPLSAHGASVLLESMLTVTLVLRVQESAAGLH